MTDEAKTKLYEFQNLSYDEKLEFWDNNGNNFRYEVISIDDDTYISITPYHPAERISYNKWIINHWRQYYFSGKHRKPGFSFNYKSYEEYTTSFYKKIKFRRKGDVINTEITIIGDLITLLKVKRHILKTVYYNLKNLEEEAIYEYVIDASSVLLNLRFIAQIFDLVKYIIFLKNERSLLKANEKAKPVYFKNMSARKIEIIYHFLIEKSFIAPNTEKDCFTKLLSNDDVPEDFHVIWIDLAPISKQVNKHTLFEFITPLVTDHKNQRVILKKHFKTLRLDIPGSVARDLNTENIKKSWSRWITRKSNDLVSARQVEIQNLAKIVD